MLFITINLILLVWSTGYLNFLEEKFIIKDDIVVIKPDNIFKKQFLLKMKAFLTKKVNYGKLLKIRKNQRMSYKLILLKKMLQKKIIINQKIIWSQEMTLKIKVIKQKIINQLI